VQTRVQVDKFKTKEQVEKEKDKDKNKKNVPKTSKQQEDINQIKNSPQINYNVIDDLIKLRITLPFMEVVKNPQQRENILKIFDDPTTRMEVVVTNPKKH
jgi:hypothetical protein